MDYSGTAGDPQISVGAFALTSSGSSDMSQSLGSLRRKILNNSSISSNNSLSHHPPYFDLGLDPNDKFDPYQFLKDDPTNMNVMGLLDDQFTETSSPVFGDLNKTYGRPERGQQNIETVETPQISDMAVTSPINPPKPSPIINKTPRRRTREPLLYKATVGLLSTYNLISKLWELRKRLPSNTENGELIIKRGQPLIEQYQIMDNLGQGIFAQCVKAFDKSDQSYVAIKIIKADPYFYYQGQLELKILRHLYQYQNETKYVVRVKNFFEYENHICIVFEELDLSLISWLQLTEKTGCRGMSLRMTQEFGCQILKALQFLAHPEIGVVHCDLKPENIFINQNTQPPTLKIIDFGSSCFNGEQYYKQIQIQSRFYRCPEVLLGLPFGTQIDMWSVGCILVELYTGEPLFPGENSEDQLCKICSLLGMPTAPMLQHAPLSRVFFNFKGYDPRGIPTWEFKKRFHKRLQTNRTLEDILGPHGPHRDHPQSRAATTREELLLFLDLIKRILVIDPNARMTPTEALSHAFFQGIYYSIRDTGVQTNL